MAIPASLSNSRRESARLAGIAEACRVRGVPLGDLAHLDAQVRRTFNVNLTGVFNTPHPALARMLPRRRGRLARESIAVSVICPGYVRSYNPR